MLVSFSRASLCLLCIFIIFSCGKDNAESEFHLPTKEIDARTPMPTRPMTILDAQNLYRANQALIEKPLYVQENEESACNILTPIWSMAREGKTKGGVDLVVVPVRHPDTDIPEASGAQLVFFGYDGCDMPFELIQYQSRDPLNKKNNLCEFTGGLVSINFCDCSQYAFGIEDGEIATIYEDPITSFETCTYEPSIQTRGLKFPCPSFGKSWWSRIKDWFSNAFSGNSGNSGTTTVIWISGNGGWNGFRFGFPNYGHDPDADDFSGGGRPTLINLFDFNILSGEGQKALKRLNEIIAQHDLVMCTSQLHNLLYQCISSDHPDPGSCGLLVEEGIYNDPDTQEEYEIEIFDYITALEELEGSDPCLSNIIDMFSEPSINMKGDDGLLLCFIEDSNEFDIEDEALLALIQDACNGDNECEKKKFECLNKLTTFQQYYEMVLTEEQLTFLAFSGVSNTCDLDGEELAAEVFSMLTEFDQEEANGTKIRLLECHSFQWVQVGEGWVSCLDPSNMQIEIGGTGVYFDIELGCLSYTIPKTRADGSGNIYQWIDYDEASSCAALAANLASVQVKMALNFIPSHKLDTHLTRNMLSLLYKRAFKEWMEQTSCGYGSIASCTNFNCPGGTNEPSYTDDFIEVTEESLLGGCH